MDTFHRSFIRRIALACILISALTGLAGLLLEMVKMDRMAESLARAEVARLTALHEGSEPPPPEALGQWQEIASRSLKENGLLLRVYGPQGDLAMESCAPAMLPFARQLRAKLMPIERNRGAGMHRFVLDGRPMVQVRQPLADSHGRPTGILDAVYLLDPNAVALLKGYIQRLSLAALLSTLATGAVLYPLLLSLHRRARKFSEDLASANLELASVLGSAIAQRDSGTGSHNFRVTLYAIQLGLEVEDPALDMRALILGAFLHDVGKIGIHDAILLKPGPLTAEERMVMCSHVERGVAIIESSNWLHLARNVIECHHERFDGAGYPRGLSGRNIPLEARVFAIVDAFDALTSARPYKPPIPLPEVLTILDQEAGRHFDPDLVARFGRIAAKAFRDIGGAAEVELQARLKAWVDQHRSFLHTDQSVTWKSLAGPLVSGPKTLEGLPW
ncbi:MAG: HD-GYP domain-containing protein [Geothrix sp.]|nr:HD-GYP domain-containing protein [Geothrix sp.]